jgi:hypothetical protein
MTYHCFSDQQPPVYCASGSRPSEIRWASRSIGREPKSFREPLRITGHQRTMYASAAAGVPPTHHPRRRTGSGTFSGSRDIGQSGSSWPSRITPGSVTCAGDFIPGRRRVTNPIGTASQRHATRRRVDTVYLQLLRADIHSGQATIDNAPCELQLSMCLPTGWNCVATPRRTTASRHGLPPATISRQGRRRPDRQQAGTQASQAKPRLRSGSFHRGQRPGAQPSLFTRAICKPRTPFRVISSSTVEASTYGLTHVHGPPYLCRHLSAAILTTPWGRRHLDSDVTSVSPIDIRLNSISGSGIDM